MSCALPPAAAWLCDCCCRYGLLMGGVDTHRMDLSSMARHSDCPSSRPACVQLTLLPQVMLKDNHIAATGSIPSAVAAARALCGFSVKIEVECSCAADALAAAGAGADVVMLDNLQPHVLAVEAAAVKKQFPHVLPRTWLHMPSPYSASPNRSSSRRAAASCWTASRSNAAHPPACVQRAEQVRCGQCRHHQHRLPHAGAVCACLALPPDPQPPAEPPESRLLAENQKLRLESLQ